MVATIKFSQFAAASLSNTTNKLVGVSSLSGGSNFYTDFPLIWTTAGRPSTPAVGTLGYNSNLGQYEFWNGAAWVQLSAGGSGSVNLGSQNQLAWYAANGTAVSGLLTSNSSVLTTNSSGVPDWSTTLPSGLTIPIPSITGVTDGSNAASGVVGEYISASILIGSAVSLTSTICSNVTSISLTAGDWDITGTVYFDPSPGTISNYQIGGISQTSATFETPATNNNNAANGSITSTLPTDYACNLCIGNYSANLTTTKTIYLIAQSSFTGGMGAYGFIAARRAR